MHRTVLATLLCLLGAAAALSKFPTDLNELTEFERLLAPKGATIKKLDAKDLDDPDKLTQLADQLERMAKAPGKKSARRQRNKRQLFLKSAMQSVNAQGHTFGKIVKPVPEFFGVDFNSPRDTINTGLGLGALALGVINKKNREGKFQRMYAILEHKYHLNNLYLDSIHHQNSNAHYASKVLRRVAGKVIKTRKAILGKIHASINPLN